jgi:hypothetical protein
LPSVAFGISQLSELVAAQTVTPSTITLYPLMVDPPSDIGVDQAMNTDLLVVPFTRLVESERGELGVVRPMCRPSVT